MKKTQIPSEITTIEEAQKFLTELFNNGELYHMDMDAHDMMVGTKRMYTKAEANAINKALKQCSDTMGYTAYSDFVYQLCSQPLSNLSITEVNISTSDSTRWIYTGYLCYQGEKIAHFLCSYLIEGTEASSVNKKHDEFVMLSKCAHDRNDGMTINDHIDIMVRDHYYDRLSKQQLAWLRKNVQAYKNYKHKK